MPGAMAQAFPIPTLTRSAPYRSAFGPLPETLVRIALDHAVRLRGTGRHVRVYLAILGQPPPGRTGFLQHSQMGQENCTSAV